MTQFVMPFEHWKTIKVKHKLVKLKQYNKVVVFVRNYCEIAKKIIIIELDRLSWMYES